MRRRKTLNGAGETLAIDEISKEDILGGQSNKRSLIRAGVNRPGTMSLAVEGLTVKVLNFGGC